MYMRAVTIRIVYLGVLSLGILLGAAFRDSTVQAAPAAHTRATSARVETAVAAPTVTLPTVRVRHATLKTLAIAKAPAADRTMADSAAETTAPQAEFRGGASLPTLRLDMPYYSVGKLLPRVGKE